VEVLLKHGADANRIGPGGATALLWAVPDVDKVRLLIAHGANVNARSETDRTALLVAASYPRTINLLNGRVETGVLAAEDDQSITLKTENAVLKQIQKKDIDDIKVQEKSLMPEGLANNMSVQDFRDLVRYVMANPFITSGSAHGSAHSWPSSKTR